MIVFRVKAGLGCVFGGLLAAQNAFGQASGEPRVLAPDDARPVPLERPYQPPSSAPSEESRGTFQSRPRVLGGGDDDSVRFGDLGNVEGPVAGALPEGETGLPYDAWAGSDRAQMADLLDQVPDRLPSPAARLLLRKALFSAAPPPAGSGGRAFNAVRVRKALDAGMLTEAAALSAALRVPDNEEISRTQADALLLAGRDDDACGDATAFRLTSAEPFWIELRAYCYAIAGETEALSLTRAVMDAQGLADADFSVLLQAVLDEKTKVPDSAAASTPLHARLLARLGRPLPETVVQDFGLSGAALVLQSEQTPKDIKQRAAERLFVSGALDAPMLAQALDLMEFAPGDLSGAAALARAEASFTGLARLRAALAAESLPDRRGELIHAAFQIGAREGVLRTVADIFAEDALSLPLSDDWDHWAVPIAKGLLLAGHVDGALRWFNILDAGNPAIEKARDELVVGLSLAAPWTVPADEVQAALIRIVAPTRDAVAPISGADLSRATLYLGLADALGRPVPPELRPDLEPLLNAPSAGRQPPPRATARMDEASLAGRSGETVLAALDALGGAGPGDLAADASVGIVRALRTAGVNDAALAVAIESIATEAP